jgi:glycolate oxidase
MIQHKFIAEITRLVGENHILVEEENIADYGTDATKLSYMPDAVVFPGTIEEVSGILQLAKRQGVAVTPRGAGSGMSGGALPVKGGLVMAMDRFDRILQVDPDNLFARVQPGVITADLQEAVEKLGLFYPPDPASIKISTIGGNVAECAGGLRAVKYGVTRDYVLGLTAVLPTGEVLRTGVKTMKGVAGYDLTRLIVGSEGTLAVITSVTLKLIPKPEKRKTMLSFFRDISGAVRTVSEITREKIVPAILELLDHHCLDCLREEMATSIPSGAKSVLLIEVDGDEALVSKNAKKIQEVCLKEGTVKFLDAVNSEESEQLWEVRRNASPSLYKLKPDKISEDVVVPRSRMAELVEYLGVIGKEYKLPIPAFGHAGDGNIHVNIMFDKDIPEEYENARHIIKELFEKVIQMEGTITGEHGIGMTKAPYFHMEISSSGVELMKRIKKAFDPNGILNPGKIFL